MTENLEYNSTREKLIIAEYGRHIQKMVTYCAQIEDPQERVETAKAIVSIMSGICNMRKDINGEFNRKLWDHLYIISDWKLEIEGPFPAPDRETVALSPTQLEYTQHRVRIRHFGSNIQRLIDKTLELEEGESKEATKLAIANQLKKSYLRWNTDSVADTLILRQLEVLSDGNLKLPMDTVLVTVAPPPKKEPQQSSGGRRKKVMKTKRRR